MWDEHTGVPMAVHGSGIPAPGTVNDAAEAERFTRAFIAQHIAILAPGASASDLQLVDNISDGEMRTVGFVQTYKGMKVIDAHLIFEFKNDRLFVFGSTAFPNIKLPERHWHDRIARLAEDDRDGVDGRRWQNTGRQQDLRAEDSAARS